MEAIRTYKPTKLYISGDGPNPDRSSDVERCEEVRALTAQVDWECEVFESFAGRNLGCRAAVSSGISWFFENEPEGIILEDDCVPNDSFFKFLEEVVERFRDDKEIWGATGANTFHLNVPSDRSYDFIPYALIWGWATWADRWEKYDKALETWTTKWKSSHDFKFRHWQERAVFSRTLSKIKGNRGWDSWAFPWSWTVLSNRGLWIIPKANMMTNIGLGADATHTTWEGPSSNWVTNDLEEVIHPHEIQNNPALADEVLLHQLSAPPTAFHWLTREVRTLARNAYRRYKFLKRI